MPNLFTKKILAPEKQILAFPDHYVTLPAVVRYSDTTALKGTDSAGRPVIKRGTIVYVSAAGEVSKPTASNKPNAVIFNTIYLDEFDTEDTLINAAVLVHGFVRADRLVVLDGTNGTAALLATTNPMIFVTAN